MKNVKVTTEELTSKLSILKMTRRTTTAITDKAMTSLAVDVIAQGDLTSLSILTMVDEDTGELIEQSMLCTDTESYTTCSRVVTSLVNDLIELVNSGEVNIEDIGLEFRYMTSKTGNKYLSADIL